MKENTLPYSRIPKFPSFHREPNGLNIKQNVEDIENVRVLDYNSIFMLVKKHVKEITGLERSGIGLALSDLPSALGAFWEVSGNYLVVNELLVKGLQIHGVSSLELNSYVYSILLHEYLHSLGFIDEQEDRNVVEYVSEKSFGKDHPITAIAKSNPWAIYPFLLNIPGGNGSTMRFVRNFDRESTSYIM